MFPIARCSEGDSQVKRGGPFELWPPWAVEWRTSMSSGLSRRLQLGIVLGLCETGMASAQRTPSADASAGFPAAGSVIKDCPQCPDLLVVPPGSS